MRVSSYWDRKSLANHAEAMLLVTSKKAMPVSPMRTRYVFTSRLRSRAFVYSPEELARELASGRAALVVEPVPLVDRAVSAALDRIGAQRPQAKAA